MRSDSDDSEFSPVASEERNALLSTSPDLYEDTPQPIETPPSNSPTQRLLTALGRFERQVAKAREGAPQEVWSDECMDQLINAVEIAVGEGWSEIIESLTETGRVLHSYEKVGQAHLCVPFLGDSYEIMCLMVGDIIVGKFRSGVMQKWRSRHRLALEEMNAAGIPLADDNDEPAGNRAFPVIDAGEDISMASRRVADVEAPRNLTPFVDRNPRVSGEASAEHPARSESLEYSARDVAEEGYMVPESDVEETLAGKSSRAETPDAIAGLPPLTPLGGDLFDDHAYSGGEAGTSANATEAATSKEVIERLDVLCEQLSSMERDPATDAIMAFVVILESVDFLEAQASKLGRRSCVELCHKMSDLCTGVAHGPSRPDDKFFELAYAFCGVYVEADDRPDNPMVRSWVTECNTLLDSLAAHEAGTVQEETDATVEPEDRVTQPTPMATASPLSELDSGLASVTDRADVMEVDGHEGAGQEDNATEEESLPVWETAVNEADEAFYAADSATAIEPGLDDGGEDFTDGVTSLPLGDADAETPIAVALEMPLNEDAEDDEEASAMGEVHLELHEDESNDGGERESESSAAVRMAVPVFEPVLTPTEDTPEGLLLVAQQAMTSGRVAEAKSLALRAAVMVAQLEVEEAQGRVGDAEKRLRQGAELIEQARQDVQRAESMVSEATRNVGDGSKNLETQQGEAETTQQRLAEVEARVAELDEQIRQLQELRDEEASRMADTRLELESARERVAKAEATLQSLREEEEEARVRLEDARQRVKNLQRKRADVETAMERARQKLAQQQLNLADIQQTLSQIGKRSAEPSESPDSDMLF